MSVLVLVPVMLEWCQAGLWTLTATYEVKTDARKVQAARCTPWAIPAAAAWHNPLGQRSKVSIFLQV